MIDPQAKDEVNVLWVGILVEGGLLVIGLLLGWVGLYDHCQPIESTEGTTWLVAIRWGTIALLPMLCYLILFHFWTPGFYRPMQQTIDTKLRPMFANASYLEMAVLSLFAGFGEELFFRWCLQGGITSLSEPWLGSSGAIALGISVASIVFGLCHWVNSTYAVTTLLIGAYLGGVMVWSGTWLAPAICHALFDFIALIYIARSRPKTSFEFDQ